MDTIFQKLRFNLFLLFIFTSLIIAQTGYKTIVKLTDMPDEVLLKKMERNSTELLSEINTAFFQNRKPEVSAEILTTEARRILGQLWETSPFRCYETQIIGRVLQMSSLDEKAFQVRNIPVFIKNIFEKEDTTINYQEICMNYNSSGLIENIFYSLESNRYHRLLSDGVSVTDIKRRAFILEFIENFRTAYNRKDIKFLEEVYGEDALIITGKVIQTKPSEISSTISGRRIEYKVSRKTEYLQAVKDKIFTKNNYVNIIFEEINISRDKGYDYMYGVTLKQYWNTTNYSDVGYLFLMIDFKNESKPIIHVRTWQPEEWIKQGEQVFNLGDFAF